jgi:hypothetical protein
MKPKRPSKSKALQPAKPGFDGLRRELREFITESRRQVLRTVDVVQVRTCWGVGRHIVEFEQVARRARSTGRDCCHGWR